MPSNTMNSMDMSEDYALEAFTKDYVCKLLDNKFIIIIGDSNQRGNYKDLVIMLDQGRRLQRNELRDKGEMSFSGDQLIEGGSLGEMNNGVRYREVRQYVRKRHMVRFYFVTRSMNEYMKIILKDIAEGPKPDLVIMNSCLWDISRYGVESNLGNYVKSLQDLCVSMQGVLPEYCPLLWLTALPISGEVQSGFLTMPVRHLRPLLPRMTREANVYASRVIEYYGYDVLDLHCAFWSRLYLRANDGIHWDSTAHRFISALILRYLAKLWNAELPYCQPARGIRRLPDPPAADLYARTPLTQTYRSNVPVMSNYSDLRQQLVQAAMHHSAFAWATYEPRSLQHGATRDQYYTRRQAPYSNWHRR